MRPTHSRIWRKGVEPARLTDPALGRYATTAANGHEGAFRIKCGEVVLFVIASDGGGWDHVSVSRPDRCPTWEEMAHVKALFFSEEEAAMQLHPPASEYVNNHPHCLHLWRPQAVEIPRPPEWMVGIKKAGEMSMEAAVAIEEALS